MALKNKTGNSYQETYMSQAEQEAYVAETVFNQAQLELLDMMQWVKSPEVLAELKQVISDFFAKKGQEELNAMWERGEMTEEKLKSFEALHERTPYRG